MPKVKIYTTNYCPYCVAAKNLLSKKGVVYEEINVEGDAEKRRWLAETTGRTTVPQIFIEGTPVGGFDDIKALDQNGDLDKLLQTP